jgi:hypothetical protein
MELYQIFFKDGTMFKGGDIIDTKWSLIPNNKEISRLEYYLPNGNRLILEGYDQYVNIVEVFYNLIGGHKNKSREITNVYIIGAKNNMCDSYRITLKDGESDSRYKVGDITVRHGPMDKIYQDAPVFGWKGIKK